MTASELFTALFCGAGLFFFLAGTVGLMRFPDILCRLHALTKADHLGLGLIVIGLLPQLSSLLDLFRLVLVWILVVFSSAACSYLIALQVLQDQSLSSRSIANSKKNKEQLMNLEIAFDGLLVLSCLVLAWMSIFSVSLFRCIVFFVCLGLLVTIAWGQLGAFDVAIAEAAIGAGITGALLLAAWNRIRPAVKDVAPEYRPVKDSHQEPKEHV